MGNTQFSVGVHVLTLLSTGRRQSSTDMAASVGSNPVHVRRVLGMLRRAGLVASAPGAAGGWELTVDPATTTLRDVWVAVGGDQRVLGVHDAAPECEVGQSIQARLTQVERDAAAALAAELGRTTVADVCAATPAAA